LVRAWDWARKAKVSLADKAGMVAVLLAPGARELIVVVLVVPRTIWLVVLVKVEAVP
jgi:hypothetical protein